MPGASTNPLLPSLHKEKSPQAGAEVQSAVGLAAVCFSEAKIKEKEARGYYIACLNLENRILRLGHCTKMKGKENIESSVITLLHATR